MNDNDPPKVEVKSFDGNSTVSVVITFPFRSQAEAFAEFFRMVFSKLQVFFNPPEKF